MHGVMQKHTPHSRRTQDLCSTPDRPGDQQAQTSRMGPHSTRSGLAFVGAPKRGWRWPLPGWARGRQHLPQPRLPCAGLSGPLGPGQQCQTSAPRADVPRGSPPFPHPLPAMGGSQQLWGPHAPPPRGHSPALGSVRPCEPGPTMPTSHSAAQHLRTDGNYPTAKCYFKFPLMV